MQEKAVSTEWDSIKEMESLIESIKIKENSIQEKELAAKLGYSAGYISECRSKKNVSKKFLNKLLDYLQSLDNPKSTTAPMIVSGDLGVEEIKELIRSNRDLAAANKDLAAANLRLASDHGELVQIAKQAFGLNLNKRPLDDRATSQEEASKQPDAADVLTTTGRSGAFEMVGRSEPRGSSKEKGK